MSLHDAQPEETFLEVTITPDEAREGVTRSLDLPDGRQVTVTIPAHTQENEIIRFDNLGQAVNSEGTPGDLVLRIFLRPASSINSNVDEARPAVHALPWSGTNATSFPVSIPEVQSNLDLPAAFIAGENERSLTPDSPPYTLSLDISTPTVVPVLPVEASLPTSSYEEAFPLSQLPTTPLPATPVEFTSAESTTTPTSLSDESTSAPPPSVEASAEAAQQISEQSTDRQLVASGGKIATPDIFTGSEIVLFDNAASEDPLAQPVPAVVPLAPLAPQFSPVSPARGKRLDRLALFGLGTALLLLILSAGGLIFDLTYYRPTQAHSAGTATAHAAPTFTAHASQTQIVYSEQTSTAQQQATVTAYQTLYNQTLSVRPFINDSLKHQSSSDWDEGSLSDHSSCSFAHNSYEVKEPSSGYFMPCFAENSFFTNFALQVNIHVVKGDEAGVFFRADDNNGGYLFEISQTGAYDLYAYGSHEVMSGQTNLYKFGQVNQLTIIARGTNYYFYLNQQFINTATDKTSGEGLIALISYDIRNTTVVDYTSFKLWLLP